MPRRRQLKGVAAGIASSFISRNNDLDGYWSLGILYKFTSEIGESVFTLNLLTGESSPEFKSSKRVVRPYYEYLLKQIENNGFEIFQISSAIVEIEFNTARSKMQLCRYTWGDPFVCRVSITDDLNKKHIYEEHGCCRKHDPNKERRRYVY